MTNSYTAVKPIKDIFEYFVSIRQEKYFHKREVLNISDRFYAYWLPLIYISPQRNRPPQMTHEHMFGFYWQIQLFLVL